MQIMVKWFAAYRDATGTAEESIETEARTVEELFKEMMQLHEQLAIYSSAMVAINDEMATPGSTIKAGDKVLFFPPVAGG